MAHRVRYHLNGQLQWFHPPLRVDTIPGAGRIERRDMHYDPDEGIVGLEPDTWAAEVGLLLDRIWSTNVGRAVIQSVRKRTTIYHTRGGPTTMPDPFEDEAGVDVGNTERDVADIDAETIGARAMILVNIHTLPQSRSGAFAWSRDASLLHELVHAVNITWGNYAIRTSLLGERGRRFGNAGEEMALVIDNMYRSELRMWLRQGHDHDAPMLPPGTIPAPMGTGLTTSESRVVARFNTRVPFLAAQLEGLDERVCPYDPFREHARTPLTQRSP